MNGRVAGGATGWLPTRQRQVNVYAMKST